MQALGFVGAAPCDKSQNGCTLECSKPFQEQMVIGNKIVALLKYPVSSSCFGTRLVPRTHHIALEVHVVCAVIKCVPIRDVLTKLPLVALEL